MDHEEYKKAYFVDPAPEPKYDFVGLHGVALYFSDYASAVAYYTNVLGKPLYVEGEFTHGWRIGDIWLTLFPSQSGNPKNAEVHFLVSTPQEADRLQKAFIDAGGQGETPSDELMFEPIRFCSVKDPFGTSILIVSRAPIKE
ncbi:MAG TPA: VOC family protein [Anaerolineales bacterium]|nr:VOC family protein [Anaerolineales bacterium]